MATSTSIYGASRPTAGPLLLPRELKLKIMNFLLPTAGVRVTSLESLGDAPQLDRAFLESRSALCNLCQVSRNFNAMGTSFLYKVVVLRSRKDLLCFFRTLLSARHLRPLVSSLVWVGVLSGLGALVQNETQLGEAIEDEEMDRVASQCWNGIDWPPAFNDDVSIIRRLNLDPTNPLTFRHFQIFGAILGMTLQLESLFTILGCVSPGVLAGGWYPECPELFGIERLLAPAQWMYGEHESIDIIYLPTTSVNALQSLRTITFEAHSEQNTQINSPALVLRLVLEFCPCLERIEIKGMNHWRLMLADRHISDQVKSELIHRNIKELILRRACYPQSSLPVIGSAFPNLRRFYAEWGNGSNDLSPDKPWQTDRDICIGLLKLKRTLEVLHLTTTPGCSWERSDFPSLLFPALGQMTALSHLTTETLWLFGQTNPFPLDIESLLPPSLVSLHLVDYWGTSEWERFYPDFPNETSPLEFLIKGMQHLHLGSYTVLSKLKAVRLTSPYFSSFFCESTEYPSIRDDYQQDIQVFINTFLQSFAEVGVEFSVAPYDSLEENGQWRWSRISSSALFF